MPLPEAFDVEIVSSERLAPRVRSFVFGRVDGRPITFEPGQWMKLVMPLDTGEIRRAYSIASSPNGTSRFELAVTEVIGGPGSGYLCGLQAGAVMRATGPQGFFVRAADNPSPGLFVATGTGVTPLRSMILAALGAGSKAPLWLLLGARHEEDLIYRDEFEALARQHTNLRVFFTLSRPSESWVGLRGYVQAHLPALWEELSVLGLREPHIYICGLERMVSAVRSLVRNEMGIGRERIHSERYD